MMCAALKRRSSINNRSKKRVVFAGTAAFSVSGTIAVRGFSCFTRLWLESNCGNGTERVKRLVSQKQRKFNKTKTGTGEKLHWEEYIDIVHKK